MRDLLLEFAASRELLHRVSLRSFSNKAEEKRYYHTFLLVDAGLMDSCDKDLGWFIITNRGHDFIGLMGQSDIWEKAKAAASKIDGYSLQMLCRIAEGIARQKLAEMGIPMA